MTESTSPKKRPDDQYDSPWKEALEEYFPESLALCFPHIHADIDWTHSYTFLDKELEKVTRHGAVTHQSVDKLVQVQRLSGEERWVLLHIDVQSQHETAFDKRLFQYNYRLFDRYDKQVVTAVIYGDESKKWRPTAYQRELWGFKLMMEFPTVKLIDYNIAELEASTNPFAVVVLAHLYTKATKHQPDERLAFKWRLTRMLYERGYSREQILSLFRYIDWLMALPPDLEQQLDQTITEYEEAQKMTFMIYRERKGYERGLEEGMQQAQQQVLQTAREDVVEVLQIRFGKLPHNLTEKLTQLNQLALLKTLHKQAVTIGSVALFEQFLRDKSTTDC